MIQCRAKTTEFVRSKWYWFIVLLVTLVALGFSLDDLVHYAGIDLRNRIVGARALLRGINPYTLGWYQEVPPPELADFHQRYPGISRVTAAPTVLFVYVPMADWNYRTQQVVWWGLQWIALGSAIVVLFRSYDCKEKSRLFLIAAVLCFVGSWFWRLHVERGQYYIFVTLLVCLEIAALRGVRKRPPWLGIPFGLAIALRPTNIVLVPLLWMMGQRRAAIMATVTSAVILGWSCYLVGWQTWKHLFETASLAAQAEIDNKFEAIHFGPVVAVAPPLIEGLDFSKELAHRSGRSTIGVLVKRPWASTLGMIIAVALVLSALLLMWRMSNKTRLPNDAALLLLVITPVLIDFTRPLRNSYVDVDLLPIVALVFGIAYRSSALILAFLGSLIFFLGPLESYWTGHLRHLTIVSIAFFVLLYEYRRNELPPLEVRSS